MPTMRSWFQGRKVAAIALATGLLISGSVEPAHANASYEIQLKAARSAYGSAIIYWQPSSGADTRASGCIRTHTGEWTDTNFAVDADEEVKVQAFYDDSCTRMSSKFGPYKAPDKFKFGGTWNLTFG